MQEVSCKTSGILRKRSDIIERRCDPEDGFLGHEKNIQLFIYGVNAAWQLGDRTFGVRTPKVAPYKFYWLIEFPISERIDRRDPCLLRS